MTEGIFRGRRVHFVLFWGIMTATAKRSGRLFIGSSALPFVPVSPSLFSSAMTDSALFDVVLSGHLTAQERANVFSRLDAAQTFEQPHRLRLCGVGAGQITEALKADLSALTQADAAVVPAGLSLKDFACAFFDMDSTLVANECIDELADLYGIKEQVAAITERSMRGELDFEHSLRERVALLKGAPASIIEKAAARLTPTPGAKETLALLHRCGVKTYITSGGFTQFARRVAADYGMAGVVCNNLVIENGVLTGEVTGPAGGAILDRSGKRRAMEVIAQVSGASLAQCIAGGDGANDLDLIGAAGFGFAYRAKPVVAQAARQRVRCGTFAVVADWFIDSWG